MSHSTNRKKKSASGMGNIRKKTKVVNGKEYTWWEARYTAGFDPGTGEQIQRSISGKTQKDVAKKLKEALSNLDNVVYQALLTEYMGIKDWVQEYYGVVDMLNDNLAEQYILTEITKTGLPKTKEEFDSFRQAIIDAANASGEFSGTATDVADSIDNVLRSQSNFASFYNTGDSYGNELSNFAETIEKLKSDYDLLATAQKEMASGEGISTNTIQALADETDRYLDYLYEENGIVHLNISAWKEYANEKILGDMAIIQSRLATLEVERDALNQELTALQSKESLTTAEQERVKELNGLLDKNTQEIASNQQAYNMYKSIFESVTVATNAMSSELKQFVGTLSQTDALDSGFSQLSTIFNDVKDGESFDFGSIVDDNFTATFGGLGESYDKFMRTIASSPSDINACRQAFNELATAYIYSSGALDNVTDSNKDAVVAMLEQMGVTNAVALVDAQLAINKERLKYTTAEYTNLTYNEVLALYQEAAAGSIAQQALAELAVQKYLEQNTTLNTEADIEQLLSLATAANATDASLARVNEAKAIMAQADSAYAQYQSEYRGGNPNDLASYRRYLELKQKANDILSTPLEYETINHLYELDKPLAVMCNVQRFETDKMARWVELINREISLLCSVGDCEKRGGIMILDWQVINSANFLKNMSDLHRYTHGKVAGAKIAYDGTEGALLISAVDDAWYCLIKANQKVPTTRKEYEKRRENISQAIMRLREMQRYLLSYFNLMHYSERVINEWCQMLTDELRLLFAIQKSDKNRFGSLS